MRTTITLDDRLLERLNKRAVESGTSVRGLIERAVIRNNVPCVALESITLPLTMEEHIMGSVRSL